METIKEINIKNRTYYFYNDIINLDEFNESKIKVDQKYFNDISDKDHILKSIKNKITEKTQDAVEYYNDYMKLKVESNNIFPTDKDVNIHVAAIVIRAIFAKDGKYYPELFLDDGLYKNVSV